MHFPHAHRGNYFTVYREGDWKLIYYYCPKTPKQPKAMLYNLKDDEEERHELSSVFPNKCREMIRNMSVRLEKEEALYPIDEQGNELKPIIYFKPIFQIKMRIYLIGLLSVLFLTSNAQTAKLKGFDYTRIPAPTGREWESPELLALNKEQPHAWFFTFADVESARRVLPEYSSYYQSLNGNWKFHWVGNPDERPADFYQRQFDVSGWDDVVVPMQWNVAGIQKDGSLKYGTPVYANQPVIFNIKWL